MGAGAWTGKMLGKYEIGELVGQGGMAQVYKGRHTALKRDVAIKLIHSFLVEGEGFIQRFQREAQIVASLRHPNIVQVFDLDAHEGVFYMVMEYIDGPTLAARLTQLSAQDKLMPPGQATELMISICDALAYAHAQGMIHRDVKPGNIMFTAKGQPVLTDFGLAKIVAGSTNSSSGMLMGTPMYMSPEQANGESGDARSDIYAMGVILFELATGRAPFNGDTPLSIVVKQINEPLPSVKKINPNVPEVIEQIIVKATQKNPVNRYQSCAEMVDALRLAQIKMDALPTVPITHPPRPNNPAPAPAPAQPASVREAPARKTIPLDGLRAIFIQVLGPVGSIMEVNRIALAMHESPTAFPADRLDELLERVSTQYRLTDPDKKAQIQRRAREFFKK